jgi:anthranilate/para-aminobenzoate synthase component I
LHTVTNLSISKRDFLETVSEGKIPPLFTEIPYAEPALVYPNFSGPESFILESVKGPYKTARYSFIGFDPYKVFKVKDGNAEITSKQTTFSPREHPLRTLRRFFGEYRQKSINDLPPFQGGAVGLFSYDFVHYIERLPSTTSDDLKVPDLHIFMVDRLLAFDHLKKKAWAMVCPGARSIKKRKSYSDWSELFDEAEMELAGVIERVKPSKN